MGSVPLLAIIVLCVAAHLCSVESIAVSVHRCICGVSKRTMHGLLVRRAHIVCLDTPQVKCAGLCEVIVAPYRFFCCKISGIGCRHSRVFVKWLRPDKPNKKRAVTRDWTHGGDQTYSCRANAVTDRPFDGKETMQICDSGSPRIN
jgi:hypothetical protein